MLSSAVMQRIEARRSRSDAPGRRMSVFEYDVEFAFETFKVVAETAGEQRTPVAAGIVKRTAERLKSPAFDGFHQKAVGGENAVAAATVGFQSPQRHDFRPSVHRFEAGRRFSVNPHSSSA
jgi:hypothetical protein